MLVHYLEKFKDQKFRTFCAHKIKSNQIYLRHKAEYQWMIHNNKTNVFQMLLFIIFPTDVCQMSWKCVQTNAMQNMNILLFCSSTVFSKLEALSLSKIGLSTIKHQHSKIWHYGQMPLEPENTWNGNANCLHEFVHIGCSKCPPFARTQCLETLSALENCSVDNVSRNVPMQMVFKLPKAVQHHT